MANYTVPSGHVAVHEKTLVASTVDVVTFTEADLPEVEVDSDGTAAIYVTFGSVAPTVGGTQCYRIPPYPGTTVLPVRTSGDTVVRLISAGTPVYSVSKTY